MQNLKFMLIIYMDFSYWREGLQYVSKKLNRHSAIPKALCVLNIPQTLYNVTAV